MTVEVLDKDDYQKKKKKFYILNLMWNYSSALNNITFSVMLKMFYVEITLKYSFEVGLEMA